MDIMDETVTSSVHSLFMDMTASCYVTVMLHTVITSTAVKSPQKVRSVINIPSVTYEIFERFRLILFLESFIIKIKDEKVFMGRV